MSDKNTVTKTNPKSLQKAVNSFRCDFPARSINEGFARVTVASFISQLDPTVSELNDLKTAVSEGVTNAIVHGYRDYPKEKAIVSLSGKYTSDGTVIITISDKGSGIPDVEKALEPMYTTAREEERSGMGFTVMTALCDKIKVSSTVGKGTRVVLQKKLSLT